MMIESPLLRVTHLLDRAMRARQTNRAITAHDAPDASILQRNDTEPGGGPWRVPRVTGGMSPWQARRALAHVESQLERGVRVRDIARVLGLSTAHFARSFKITAGIPPATYVALRRLERAKSLLISSSETLAQVALACGYSDQAHLSHAFRRRVGTSPSLWRQIHGGAARSVKDKIDGRQCCIDGPPLNLTSRGKPLSGDPL
jgi:AraC-like DNA-binding protein